MLAKTLTKRNLFLFVGGAFLAFLVFALFILIYFAFAYKGPQRVNLVFLGESGPGHTGATLTDTIIFSSVAREGTTLVSIPRDLWYQPWQTKINSLYYYSQQRGDGLRVTKEILGEILGQKIDHALLIDFGVFQDLVDLVDGVDVQVERAFDDFLYPIAGRENDPCDGDSQFKCRYEHIRFEAGPLHLNGEQALKFVRSRNAQGDEGTDTARSARQQKVILALKERIISPDVFLSPRKLKNLWGILARRVKSDLSGEDLVNLGRILLNSKAREFQSFVINGWQDNEVGFVYHPKKHSSGQWVLLPQDLTWGDMHRFIECLLFQENKSSCYPEKKLESLNF